jgi:ribosome-associated toxin RatA of RatAB toxin-antitoxin module
MVTNMPDIHKQARVPHSAEKMYNLVNDIASYPLFLPWCKEVDILGESEDEIRATLHLEKSGLRKSFTTCNRLQKNKMIEIRLLAGPFSHLEGFWRFVQHEDGQSEVMLDMEFEFANKLISFAIEPIFSQIANSLVDAFSERAKALYG